MMKKIITSLLLFTVVTAFGQSSRVQFINDSPDQLTESVDIYVDNQLVADSLLFRTATSYMSVPANQSIDITIQSSDLNDTVGALKHQNFQLNSDSIYIIMLSGLVSHTPYDSLQPFELKKHTAYDHARNSGDVDVLFFNGGTDAPVLNFDETSIPTPGFISNLGYGEFTGYMALSPNDYQIKVSSVQSGLTIAEYTAPFNTMGLADSSLVIVVSGLIDTLQSLPGDTTGIIAPKFGLWAALPSGGNLIQLPVTSDIGLPELSFGTLEIYPMPANNWLYVKNDKSFGKKITFQFVSMGGTLLFEDSVKNYGQNRFRIQVRNLSPGYYFLHAKDDQQNDFLQKIYIDRN